MAKSRLSIVVIACLVCACVGWAWALSYSPIEVQGALPQSDLARIKWLVSRQKLWWVQRDFRRDRVGHISTDVGYVMNFRMLSIAPYTNASFTNDFVRVTMQNDHFPRPVYFNFLRDTNGWRRVGCLPYLP